MPHSASPGPHAARFLGVLLLLLTTGVARVATAVVDDGSDYLRSGSLTWRPIPGTPRGIAFDLTVGMRRSAIPNPDAPDLPVVGSLVDEADVLDYGDGDCDDIIYEVTAMDAGEDWILGRALTPLAPPRTGAIDNEDEPNDALASANAIGLGGDVRGRIGPAGDVDFFQFSGTAGTRLVIDTRLTGLEDSVLTLLAADGTEIATNDDVGDSECRRSHLDVVLPSDGTFFIRVKAYDETDSGTYVLALRTAASDAPAVVPAFHVYPRPGDYTAALGSCCRIDLCEAVSAHVDNPEGDYQLETEVNVGSGNRPPVTGLPAAVDCPVEGVCVIPLPAVDPDGDPLHFRFASDDESGMDDQPAPPYCPHAPVIDAAAQQLVWDTTGCTLASDVCATNRRMTLYSTQVMIEDGTSHVPLDFMIRLVPTAPGNRPPAFVGSAPPCGRTLAARVDGALSFSVEATDPDGERLNLLTTGAPRGATVAAMVPDAPGQAAAGFTWIPTLADIGYHQVLFTATDPSGVQAFCPVTLDVRGEICGNGRDDDGDGRVDCADEACASDPACRAREILAEDCGNCRDDDGDGLVDHEDPRCCAVEVPLEPRHAVFERSEGPATHARLKVRLGAEFLSANRRPRRLALQLRDGSGEVLCATLGHGKQRLGKEWYRFKDRSGRGVAGHLVVNPDDTVEISFAGHRILPSPGFPHEVTSTLAIGGRCARATIGLHRKRGTHLLEFP